jgi:hypothetical protein
MPIAEAISPRTAARRCRRARDRIGSDHVRLGIFNVLIAGGGAAALELAFRLQRVAGRRVRTTILAPDEHFATHAMAVLVPFAADAVPRERLAGMASDAGA